MCGRWIAAMAPTRALTISSLRMAAGSKKMGLLKRTVHRRDVESAGFDTQLKRDF
jgi:hypothetical protein